VADYGPRRIRSGVEHLSGLGDGLRGWSASWGLRSYQRGHQDQRLPPASLLSWFVPLAGYGRTLLASCTCDRESDWRRRPYSCAGLNALRIQACRRPGGRPGTATSSPGSSTECPAEQTNAIESTRAVSSRTVDSHSFRRFHPCARRGRETSGRSFCLRVAAVPGGNNGLAGTSVG
jgi:hypothetical protein